MRCQVLLSLTGSPGLRMGTNGLSMVLSDRSVRRLVTCGNIPTGTAALAGHKTRQESTEEVYTESPLSPCSEGLCFLLASLVVVLAPLALLLALPPNPNPNPNLRWPRNSSRWSER
jgi:hypothetical protein